MKQILHPITGYPVQKEFIHTVEGATKVVKDFQDELTDCEITITTTSPDHAKNIENAKEFRKAGVDCRWFRKRKEDEIHT